MRSPNGTRPLGRERVALETLDRLNAAATDVLDAGPTARPAAWRQVARLAFRFHGEAAALAHDLEIALRASASYSRRATTDADYREWSRKES